MSVTMSVNSTKTTNFTDDTDTTDTIEDTIENLIKTCPTAEDVLKKHGIDYQDSKGFTFLHYYAKIGKVGYINKLLIAGSYINILDNEGRTALYYSHNEETVEFLLRRHINHKLVDNHGETADEHNEYVNHVVNNKCSDRLKHIYKGLGGLNTMGVKRKR